MYIVGWEIPSLLSFCHNRIDDYPNNYHFYVTCAVAMIQCEYKYLHQTTIFSGCSSFMFSFAPFTARHRYTPLSSVDLSFYGNLSQITSIWKISISTCLPDKLCIFNTKLYNCILFHHISYLRCNTLMITGSLSTLLTSMTKTLFCVARYPLSMLNRTPPRNHS